MTYLAEATLTALRSDLPETASACVDAIVEEVPGYHRAFDHQLRHNIETAVQQALASFVDAQARPGRERTPNPRLDGAKLLGRGEALAGRTTDALLTAYRVGARVAWSRFSRQALRAGEDAEALAALAARTFTYIDELSAASLSGHTEALTQRTRELARRRDQLAAALAAGEGRIVLERLADSAHWRPPTSLTALVVDGEPGQDLLAGLGEEVLWTPVAAGPAIALLPDLAPPRRAALLATLRDEDAALGPETPWHRVEESIRRAHRALRLGVGVRDCERLLPELVLAADPLSARGLATRATAPLSDLTDAKRDILTETLLSWLLHQGRREEVAEELHVHPQTVRYRMNQLRELYGTELSDPRGVLELVLGLVAARSTTTEDDA